MHKCIQLLNQDIFNLKGFQEFNATNTIDERKLCKQNLMLNEVMIFIRK